MTSLTPPANMAAAVSTAAPLVSACHRGPGVTAERTVR